MKKCYCCGADVPDQSKFCPKCGKPMAVTRDLIDRAMENDPEAQTELYERTYKTVYSRIRAKVPDEDTAMDIMQETYLRAFTGLDQLQKPETFPSWLLSIASRQVCDWFRKNGKENENVQMSQLEYENDDTISDEDDLLDQPEYREDFSPDESLDRAETGRLLSEILDTLPEDQRIILTMRYYDELSLKEISEELGLNINTVKTRLTAAKKKVEAKVLELEKSGTKLYSLGPVAFLVFLLHHMELFAPAISANTVIGLTAAGAGTAAGGTAVGAAAQAAAGVTGKAAAGAAFKAAGGAAVKGLGVKIAAVAAAVVVAGGITTAVVVSNNDHTAADSTPSPEESVSEEAVVMAVEPPSDDTVMEMAEDLNKWIANSELGSEQIDINLNTACELAATLVSECGYTDGEGVTRTDEVDSGGYMSEISEDALDQCLHDLFGNEYHAEDFQNTEGSGMIQTDYPDYHTGLSGRLVRTEDGNLRWDYTGWEDVFADAEPAGVTDISPVEGDEESCTATVRYDWYISDETGEQKKLDGSADVTFRLKSDENSRYGWVITAVQGGPYTETGEKVLKSKITTNDPDGECITYETYDINGNLVSREITYDGGRSVAERDEYTYDSNGNLLVFTYSDQYGNYSSYKEYDDNGNIISDTYYDDNGNVSHRYESTYDSSGNILTQTTYDNYGTVSQEEKYTYDSNGNMLTDEKRYDGDGSTDRHEYTYDSYGNMLTDTYNAYNSKYGVGSYQRNEYTYDSNGNMISDTYYGDNGNLLYRYEYTYDSNGNMLTLTDYDSNGNISDRVEYTYDTDGNMLTSTYDEDPDEARSREMLTYNEFTYDSFGNMLTSTGFNIDGNIIFRYESTYEYDSNGNMLARSDYDASEDVTYYDEEHTFDNDGNELTGMCIYHDETYVGMDSVPYSQWENTYYDRFPGDFT